MNVKWDRAGAAGRQAEMIRRMRYAYSSMCGMPVSVFSSSGRGLRRDRVSGLSSRGFRCGSGCVRGRMDGEGGR